MVVCRRVAGVAVVSGAAGLLVLHVLLVLQLPRVPPPSLAPAIPRRGTELPQLPAPAGRVDADAPRVELPAHAQPELPLDAMRAPDANAATNTERPPHVLAPATTSLAARPVAPRAHIFYYPWYGAPPINDGYMHWNHEQLPDWKRPPRVAPSVLTTHQPPHDLGSDFYPALGPYSSADPVAVQQHMQQLTAAGTGTLVLSWYPRHFSDGGNSLLCAIDQLPGYANSLVPIIMDAAATAGLKVAFLIEPYEGRNAFSVRDDMKEIINEYGDHPALYRSYGADFGARQGLPVVYLYDSYHTTADDWAKLLQPTGAASVRGSRFDGIFIALYVTDPDLSLVLRANFDGIFTYFAATGFTKGSTLSEWPKLQRWAVQNNKLFIPSLGPGYMDECIRPWNKENTRSRKDGRYYADMWAALRDLPSKPLIVSITSFNEWHEGTQIEAARSAHEVPPPRAGQVQRSYRDYGSLGPDGYLELTRSFLRDGGWLEAA